MILCLQLEVSSALEETQLRDELHKRYTTKGIAWTADLGLSKDGKMKLFVNVYKRSNN